MQMITTESTRQSCVGIHIGVGAVLPADLQRLEGYLRHAYPSMTVSQTPGGVSVLATGEGNDFFLPLASLRETLSAFDPSAMEWGRGLSQNALADNLMAIGCATASTPESVADAELFVAGSAGDEHTESEKREFYHGLEELQAKLRASACEPRPSAALQIEPPASRCTWVQSRAQSGSFMRFYRPLPRPADFEDVLARSVGNAVIGGLSNSLVGELLRTRHQYCYNPYSALHYRGGHQWIVIDADTSFGYEGAVIDCLMGLTESQLEQFVTPQRVRHAIRFMTTLLGNASKTALSRVQIELSQVDGSDPFETAKAVRADFSSDRDMYVRASREVFAMDAMNIIGISRGEMPEQGRVLEATGKVGVLR